MSNQSEVSSRLSKILRDHFFVLIGETLTKLKVIFFFSNGFELEYRSIIQNCMEIEDTWFGLKNHISILQNRERCEGFWFDKKCQFDFLVGQLRKTSEKFPNGFDAEDVKNLRACLQLLKTVLDEVSCEFK
jgi:hypothetical protein